ncbi:MAG: ATP-binding protein [Patescibacteria group bacterium]
MRKYQRTIEKDIEDYLTSDDYEIFFIWGPRRSGKTTLLKQLSEKLSVPVFNFDILSDREPFVRTREALGKLASDHKIILIDEIQNYPEGTIAVKILHDEYKVKIIATGSSELRQKSKDFDTLAGRFTEHFCLPLSIYEITQNSKFPTYEESNFLQKLQKDLQIFGAYPEVYTNTDLLEAQKIDLLQIIFDTYILKDIIDIYNLKNTKLAKDILTKIALQIGSEVSINEIANDLKATASTVSDYIEIFIKNYVLIPLPSFKTNLRRAVSANRKLFFYDLGIRNILVKDFRELDIRPDKGGVFENFIVSEIEKQRRNQKVHQSLYFYREYGGQEVDLVLEDYKKQYKTLEIKANEDTKSKDIFPVKHDFKVINSKNYFNTISETVK